MSGRDLLAAGDLDVVWRLDGDCLPPESVPPAGLPGATLLDVCLPCSVRALTSHLCAPRAPFQAVWLAQLRASGVEEGPWALRSPPAPAASRTVTLATPPPPAWAYLVGNTVRRVGARARARSRSRCAKALR